MLYGEFRERDLECADCPIKDADFCSGGIYCTGGVPIEPPCCCFDDDTDMDEWVTKKFEDIRRFEEAEDRRIRAQKEKEAKNKLAQERRRQSQWHVRLETREINRLKKRINGNESAIRLADTFRLVNAMFSGDDVESKDKHAHPLAIENEQLRTKIKELEGIKKQKLKDFRKQRSQVLVLSVEG